MQMIPVQSSHIASIGYDAQACLLAVTFTGGRTYHYVDVPQMEYAALMQADSKGAYLRRSIIPHYPSTKQEGTADASDAV